MTIKTYTRLQLAADQLRTAVCLFIAGRDRFSVITLAGAADVILSRLVLNSGQENFTDAIIRLAHRRFSGTLRASSISLRCHAPFV